jgi:hypothetical protein
MRFLGFSNHEKAVIPVPLSSLKLAANGLQNVFERCKKCIACHGRYFEEETVTAPPQSSDSE